MEDPMKKLAVISLAAVLLLLATATPSMAWRGGYYRGGGRVFVGVGVGPYWGYPYWGYPYYYYPPPYYSYGPPTVVVQQPPTYIQQDVQVAPAAPAAPAPQAYWYYCTSSQTYYPSVQTCAEPWVKVPPRQE
jgi:hypothetical protein